MAGFGDGGFVLGAAGNWEAAESVITCMAGFVCAGHPQPPGGRIVIPASFK
jgi:hypothetical protein